jgi:hypothetical protein
VVLAAVAGGLRPLLAGRGENIHGLVQRAMVTISRHEGQPGYARGNRPGWMMVPLPLGEPHPVRRLDLIAAETAARKHQARPACRARGTRARKGGSAASRDSGSAGICHASFTTSSSPARRSSTSMPGSATASVSVLMPMQQSALCEMSVIIAAQPGSGPNGYMWVICEPAM